MSGMGTDSEHLISFNIIHHILYLCQVWGQTQNMAVSAVTSVSSVRCVFFFWSHIDLWVHNNKDSGNDYDNDSELERDNYALVLNNENNGKGNGNSYGNDMTVNLKMLVTMT